jgi:hypothetical protein
MEEVSGVPDRPLRSRCLGIIASLPIPKPFDLEQFRANLERHRGRPLLLLPDAIATDCSGIWIGAEHADFIFYARDTTVVHQRHIIVHEIGHMAFGHQGARVDGGELALSLFPDLSPDLVRSALARTAYSEYEEREAETFASVLLRRAHLQPAAPELRPDDAEALQRVAGAFSLTQPGYGRQLS